MPPTPSQANLEGLSESQRVEEHQHQLAKAELRGQLAEQRIQLAELRTQLTEKRAREARLEAQLTDLEKQHVLYESQRFRDDAAATAAAATNAATNADPTREKERYAHQGALNAQRVPTAGSGTAEDPMEM